jgi:amino acid transporter
MAYMGASARVGWMMGRCGLLPSSLGRLNRQAVPSVALLVSLAMGMLMLLSGPSWQTVVSFLTATLVIALAVGPVSLIALRHQLPQAHRAYRLPCARLWCTAAFVLATWAISWCGSSALRGASLIVLVPAGLFALADRQQLRQGLWWFLYLGGIVAITAIELGLITQLSVLAAWALVVFPIATRSRLAQAHPDAQIDPAQ